MALLNVNYLRKMISVVTAINSFYVTKVMIYIRSRTFMRIVVENPVI